MIEKKLNKPEKAKRFAKRYGVSYSMAMKMPVGMIDAAGMWAKSYKKPKKPSPVYLVKFVP